MILEYKLSIFILKYTWGLTSKNNYTMKRLYNVHSIYSSVNLFNYKLYMKVS